MLPVVTTRMLTLLGVWMFSFLFLSKWVHETYLCVNVFQCFWRKILNHFGDKWSWRPMKGSLILLKTSGLGELEKDP